MSPVALLAAALAACSVLAILAYVLSGQRSAADEMARRLSQYGGTAAPEKPQRVLTGNAVRDALDGVTSALNPLLSRTAHTGKLAEDLQRADLKLKSSEWVLAVVGVGILVSLLLALRFGNFIFLLAGPVAVWFLSGLFLRFRQRRRTRAFNNQL